MWPFIWTNLNFLYLSRGDRFKAGKEQGWRKKRLGVKQREQAKTDRDGEQLKWSDTPQGVKRTKSKSSILSKHTLFQFWLKLAKWLELIKEIWIFLFAIIAPWKEVWPIFWINFKPLNLVSRCAKLDIFPIWLMAATWCFGVKLSYM